VAEELVDALGHFAGGLVGKGDGEDGVGGYAFFLDEPGDAAGDDAGFAGAGAGEDEERPIGGFHGGTLFRIEFFEERVHGVSRRERFLALVYRVWLLRAGQLVARVGRYGAEKAGTEFRLPPTCC